MDFQGYSAIAFIIILAIVLYIERKKLVKQNLVSNFIYILMYKTSVGIKFMDKIAKNYKGLVKYFGYSGIFVGFLGMIAICLLLLKGTYDLLFIEGAQAAVGIVQPFKAGVPGTFFVPFFYFIISLFVLVIVHEFSHGVLARLYKLKIKSSGLAFFGIILPIIPAAFVEPDEKELMKRPMVQQLAIFGAGPFANIVLAFLIIGFLLVAGPSIANAFVEYDGVIVSDLTNGGPFPAELAGIEPGEVIIEVGGKKIDTITNLSESFVNRSPGENIVIVTNKTSYNVVLGENPSNKSLPHLGVQLGQHSKMAPRFESGAGLAAGKSVMWILGLMIWLYALNLGIGLFNLLPIPITDGGRMLYLALERFMKKEKAFMIWKFVAMLFILLIVVNIGGGFIK